MLIKFLIKMNSMPYSFRNIYQNLYCMTHTQICLRQNSFESVKSRIFVFDKYLHAKVIKNFDTITSWKPTEDHYLLMIISRYYIISQCVCPEIICNMKNRRWFIGSSMYVRIFWTSHDFYFSLFSWFWVS